MNAGDEDLILRDRPLGLRKAPIPDLPLMTSLGTTERTTSLFRGRTIVYVYPATGVPGQDPAPNWDDIPGAAGCTVQGLGFKQFHGEFRSLGLEVMGLSTQPSSEQAAFAKRNHIPFLFLSDQELLLAEALRLPRFEAAGRVFLKRLVFIAAEQTIEQVFYPVLKPAESAGLLLKLLLAEQVPKISK